MSLSVKSGAAASAGEVRLGEKAWAWHEWRQQSPSFTHDQIDIKLAMAAERRKVRMGLWGRVLPGLRGIASPPRPGHFLEASG